MLQAQLTSPGRSDSRRRARRVRFSLPSTPTTTLREIDGPIVDYFEAVNREIGDDFAIGAYGSGAVLSKLLHERLIRLPWISMSRAFLGTEQFFYSRKWAMRQVPPDRSHPASGVGYDRNVVAVSAKELGAFQVDASGNGFLVWDENLDATLGQGHRVVEFREPSAAERFVATDGLRLRNAPNGVIIRDLTIGERVEVTGDAGNAWLYVRAGSTDGVAFGKYLREPARPAVEALLQATFAEWLRFEKGEANEKADPYYRYVRDMWAAIGEPYDGRSKYSNGEDVPWSAAFISWVVRQAGQGYENFRFAARHSEFVNNAIKARVTNREDKPFWGYRTAEKRPELGDIIQRNRGGNNFSYSYAENHEQYNSHSDIVVEVTPDVVRVIGGNVGDTVSYAGDVQEYHLDAGGYLLPNQKVIALLKNRVGLLGDDTLRVV